MQYNLKKYNRLKNFSGSKYVSSDPKDRFFLYEKWKKTLFDLIKDRNYTYLEEFVKENSEDINFKFFVIYISHLLKEILNSEDLEQVLSIFRRFNHKV